MTNEDIKRIRELIEFLVKQKVSEKVNKLSKDEKGIYDLTGEKGVVEITKITNFSAGKISKIWQKLEKEGLLLKEGKGYKKVV